MELFYVLYPPCSPDLASSDFRLFTHLEQFMGGTRMRSDEEMKKMVKDWFNALAAEFYVAATQKLVTRYKCLNLHGDYAEKLFKVCSNDEFFFILFSYVSSSSNGLYFLEDLRSILEYSYSFLCILQSCN
jgi:hypothetical protein